MRVFKDGKGKEAGLGVLKISIFINILAVNI
jgi:hypothetical protein